MPFCSDIHNHINAVLQIFREAYGPDRSGDTELIKALCSSPSCFGLLVRVGGQPAGFIMLRQADDTADIIEVCVRPPVQNRGIGRQLLDEALHRAEARGVNQVLLEVAVTNKSALRLYRSAGFELVGKRPAYYRLQTEKIDALVMECRLPARRQ
ncbi:MAG: ribosomal protein S18-alanine N-acetyltransferase [Pseudomonadota bacterium]|nr:ribosomal protein S18-alanine N-acetyltransferase [Pseudomonadota bacterium]